MTIVAITQNHTEQQMAAIFPAAAGRTCRIIVASPEAPSDLESLISSGVDAVFDLDFVNAPGRVALLKKALPVPVFVNAVDTTLAEIGEPFIRLNGWPGFLEREIHELAAGDDESYVRAAGLYEKLGHAFRRVPDIAGMVSSRILATIINEAWYTWEEKVSSKEEIDTAMKLGTNYPMGPFEWGGKIGLTRIEGLLTILTRENTRYTPATSLQEAVRELKYN